MKSIPWFYHSSSVNMFLRARHRQLAHVHVSHAGKFEIISIMAVIGSGIPQAKQLADSASVHINEWEHW